MSILLGRCCPGRLLASQATELQMELQMGVECRREFYQFWVSYKYPSRVSRQVDFKHNGSFSLTHLSFLRNGLLVQTWYKHEISNQSSTSYSFERRIALCILYPSKDMFVLFFWDAWSLAVSDLTKDVPDWHDPMMPEVWTNLTRRLCLVYSLNPKGDPWV